MARARAKLAAPPRRARGSAAGLRQGELRAKCQLSPSGSNQQQTQHQRLQRLQSPQRISPSEQWRLGRLLRRVGLTGSEVPRGNTPPHGSIRVHRPLKVEGQQGRPLQPEPALRTGHHHLQGREEFPSTRRCRLGRRRTAPKTPQGPFLCTRRQLKHGPSQRSPLRRLVLTPPRFNTDCELVLDGLPIPACCPELVADCCICIVAVPVEHVRVVLLPIIIRPP